MPAMAAASGPARPLAPPPFAEDSMAGACAAPRFLPEEVPHASLRAIFAFAQGPLPGGRVPCWTVHVVSGAACDALREHLALAALEPFADGAKRMGPGPVHGFGLFGAPHVAFVCVSGKSGLCEAAEAGMYVQRLVLAMAPHGVAACVQTAPMPCAQALQETLGLGPRERLLLALAFGYPDLDAPARPARLLPPDAAAQVQTVFHRS